MADATPRTVTLPLRAWMAAAIVVVAFLGVFAAQIVLMAQQRELIDHQDATATKQAVRSRPVLRTLDALIGGSPEAALQAAHRAGDALDGLQGLLTNLRQEDLVRVAATSLRELPRVVDMTRATVRILERTYPTLRTSLSVQERSLAIQERALADQRKTVSLARETLAVARATLSHTESIDRKTGGQLPPAVP